MYLTIELCGFLLAQGAVLQVPGGGDFQAALNAANPGDTIVLQAGATYTGHFRLPNKSGTAYITVQSSALSELPPAGVRVSPAYAGKMPKLVTPDSNPVLVATGGAHHFRFVGIEFAPAAGVYVNDLLLLGAYESSTTAMPQYLDFDRVYIHGDPRVGSKRGVALQDRNTTIRNSYLSDFKSTWQDSQAIAGWAGPGPYRIINNHLEASGEAVAFGGAIPVIANIVPSDIEIRSNHFFKPLSWRKGDPTFAGVAWMIKNHLELKFAQRVTIDGNIFENNWIQGDQKGFAVQFTVRDESDRVPWAVIQDITFSNNIVRHSGAGINIYTTEGQGVRRITIKNNLFTDLSSTWGGDGRLYQILGGSDSITIDHNTALHRSYTIAFACGAETNFTFTNNIDYGDYSIASGNTQPGTATLNYCAPGAIVRGNVIAGPSTVYPFPSGNYIVTTGIAGIGFVDPANGDYRLSSSSPYITAATDGQAVGINVNELNAALTSADSTASTSTLSSIWSNDTKPALLFYPHGPIELGLKFRSDVAGMITGVRFYKAPGNTGTHTGSLWNASGALLATGTFSNETPSGWQQLTFAKPVSIAANTTYIISYHTNTGFSVDVNYFASKGVDHAPLHALQSGNGLFINGSGGQVPSITLTHNYWVDVLFRQ